MTQFDGESTNQTLTSTDDLYFIIAANGKQITLNNIALKNAPIRGYAAAEWLPGRGRHGFGVPAMRGALTLSAHENPERRRSRFGALLVNS